MVAYSFKAQFAEPIAEKTKVQTIRADRKRHARLGEALQLYTGMRTRQCRLIGRAICIGFGEVQLDFNSDRARLWTGDLWRGDDLDAYARRDGFVGWEAMRRFWGEEHPSIAVFTGVQIEWGATFEPAEP